MTTPHAPKNHSERRRQWNYGNDSRSALLFDRATAVAAVPRRPLAWWRRRCSGASIAALAEQRRDHASRTTEPPQRGCPTDPSQRHCRAEGATAVAAAMGVGTRRDGAGGAPAAHHRLRHSRRGTAAAPRQRAYKRVPTATAA